MQDWIAALGAQLLDRPDDVAALQTLLTAMAGGDGAAFLEACRLIGEAAEPQAALDAVQTLPDALPARLVGALVIHAFATLRQDYASRQDAAAARTQLAAFAGEAWQAVGEAFGHAALDWLVRLVGVATVELSAVAATRAPLVRVETGLSLPSTLLAFDLYGDPARSTEIVERNRCGTAMLMPATFEALAE